MSKNLVNPSQALRLTFCNSKWVWESYQTRLDHIEGETFSTAREMKEDLWNWHQFAVMSRIRSRISPNFADGLSATLPHRHLSDREGGAAATISAPIMGAGGYLRPYFGAGAQSCPPRIIRKGGIRAAATDRDDLLFAHL